MNQAPVKHLLLSHLKEKRDWVFEGPLCEAIHTMTGQKTVIVTRRMYEIARGGYRTPYGILMVKKQYKNPETGEVSETRKHGFNIQYKYDFDTELQLKEARDRESLRFAAGL